MKVVLLPGHAKSREGAAVCAGSHVGTGEFELAHQYLPQLGSYLEAAGYEVALRRFTPRRRRMLPRRMWRWSFTSIRQRRR